MALEERTAFGRRLESSTDQYLESLAAAIETLVPLVDQYRADGEYSPIVERIRQFESDCDERRREIGGLITDVDPEATGIRLTWVYLHADRLLGLYEALETVANSAEQFATELEAIAPPRKRECLDGLYRMAEYAAIAVDELKDAVSAFVRALCRPDYVISITEPITRIRTVEAETDAIRSEVLSTAFDGEHDGTGVIYRQLAVLLDGVLDAIEDVTDRMHLLSGTEEWLDIDIYPTPDVT